MYTWDFDIHTSTNVKKEIIQSNGVLSAVQSKVGFHVQILDNHLGLFTNEGDDAIMLSKGDTYLLIEELQALMDKLYDI